MIGRQRKTSDTTPFPFKAEQLSVMRLALKRIAQAATNRRLGRVDERFALVIGLIDRALTACEQIDDAAATPAPRGHLLQHLMRQARECLRELRDADVAECDGQGRLDLTELAKRPGK